MNPETTEEPPRYTLELCGKKAGFEVRPEGAHALDLSEAAGRLEAEGFEVLTNARILLVARLSHTEVSVFESGRLLIKTGERDLAEALTLATYHALGVPL